MHKKGIGAWAKAQWHHTNKELRCIHCLRRQKTERRVLLLILPVSPTLANQFKVLNVSNKIHNLSRIHSSYANVQSLHLKKLKSNTSKINQVEEYNGKYRKRRSQLIYEYEKAFTHIPCICYTSMRNI